MRRFHRARARRPMQWVPNVNFGLTPIALAAATVTQEQLVRADEASSATAVPNIARMTVMNIRGQVTLLAGGAAGIVQAYAMGICVGNWVNGALESPDPAIRTESDRRWLWLDSGVLVATGTGAALDSITAGASNVITERPQINIRVKTLLKPNQSLILQMKMLGVGGGTAYVLLRTLISRVA